MISSIKLENFKSIKQHRFPLRNLNVALGLNGMGKSSFIQSILLLKQSFDLITSGKLHLNGALVEVGSGKDLFYQYSKADDISIEIAFSDKTNKRFSFAYESESNILASKEKEIIYDQSLQNAIFSNNCQYLSASRIDPRVIHSKSYVSVITLHNIGIHGEYTAHYLHVFGNNDITFPNLKHPKSSTLLLMEQVNRWMGEISTGVKFNTTEIPNTDNILLDMQFEQPNLGYTKRFKPTNVGFGISYVLPVVTALLAAKQGELIIIENPESHIHPRGQAELGKLIALVAMNDVQVIIETHSDHILNGIRVAVKENDLTSEKVQLFYFERKVEDTEQFSKITNIEIYPNGDLSTYPQNLLEEWSRQLIKLVLQVGQSLRKIS